MRLFRGLMTSNTIILYFLILFISLLTNGEHVLFQSESDESLLIDPHIQSFVQLNKRQNTDGNNRTRTNTTVCYDLVGCFDNNEPFNNAAFEVPQSPDFINTSFLLFTQEKPNIPEFITYNDTDEQLIQSSINPSRWLRIIIHGFTNNRDSVWIKPLRTELLKLTDDLKSDILVVDWGQGAKFPAYANAASNTRLVGKQVGVLLERLKTLKELNYDKIHCIGHSLGAHTCGYASNAINNRMSRISGLDPAGPLFAGKRTPVRLDRDDAEFVDVVHSNTEVALGLGLGIVEESGDIDFYVNGGQSQPGCPSVTQLIGGAITGQSEAAYEQASCSHSRAHGYFIESINSECPFTSFPCHDYTSFMNGKCLVCPDSGCAQMGFYSMYSLGRGKMYLTSKSQSPFCGYHYFVEMIFDQDMPKTAGDIYVGVFSNYELLENITITPKQNMEVKAGDVLRHVFSYRADLGQVSYLVVYFNKMKTFLNWGTQKPNEIMISRLRLKSLEDSAVFSALCNTPLVVKAYTSEIVLMNRYDCYD